MKTFGPDRQAANEPGVDTQETTVSHLPKRRSILTVLSVSKSSPAKGVTDTSVNRASDRALFQNRQRPAFNFTDTLQPATVRTKTENAERNKTLLVEVSEFTFATLLPDSRARTGVVKCS